MYSSHAVSISLNSALHSLLGNLTDFGISNMSKKDGDIGNINKIPDEDDNIMQVRLTEGTADNNVTEIENLHPVKDDNDEYDVGVNGVTANVIVNDGVNNKDSKIKKDDHKDVIRAEDLEDYSLEYMSNSMFIDKASIRVREDDNEIVTIKFCSFKNPDQLEYFQILRKIKLNSVNCCVVKKIGTCCEEHFVKIEDLQFIENIKDKIEFYNHSIIKPNSILEIIPHALNSYHLGEEVQFQDINEQSFQGKLLWTGTVNDIKAGLVLLNDCRESLKPYIISGNFLNEKLFDGQGQAVFVASFVLKHDVITYITCRKTGLKIVDSKYNYRFQDEPFSKKLLLFSLNEKTFTMTLKWKGLIYSQKAIGCEMNFKSAEGSDGKYGSTELFTCSSQKGIIITADQVNAQNIQDLCEFSGHKELQHILAQKGFKIYLKKSICCIEKFNEIDQPLESDLKFTIGCKILYGGDFIGICKFIGKVNGKLSIGIQANIEYFTESTSPLDAITSTAFDAEIHEFLDIDHLTIGSYYKEMSCSINDQLTIDSEAEYYPQNNRKTTSLKGIIKWFGCHDNKNFVYGIELEEKVYAPTGSYFFEKKFECKPGHGVIDDVFKFASKCGMETNTPYKNEKEVAKEKIIRILLDKSSKVNFVEITHELIKYYDKEFMEILNEKENPRVKTEDFPKIIESLYDCEDNNIDKIRKFFDQFEKLNEIFPSLQSLLSKIIKRKLDNGIELVRDIIEKLEIPDPNDNKNSICLELAIDCLENIGSEDEEESKLMKLSQALIRKCSNIECPINISGTNKATFLTNIISNEFINEKTVVNILNLKLCDINSKNSSNASPMESAIYNCKSKVLETLFKLGCNVDELDKPLKDIQMKNDPKYKDVELICLRRLMEKNA